MYAILAAHVALIIHVRNQISVASSDLESEPLSNIDSYCQIQAAYPKAL